MSFIDEVDKHSGRKAPVQATIRKRWPDIQAALAADKSRAAIRRALAAGGYDVGRNESSFNTAYRAVFAEKAAQSAQLTGSVRQNDMADNRYTSDY